MSNYTTTVGPRPRPTAGRPSLPRPSATRIADSNTLSWVPYGNPQDNGPPPLPPSQPFNAPTPVQTSRPLPNPYPRPLRVMNATEPQNLDGDEDFNPDAFSPQYPNLEAGPSTRPRPQKKTTLMGGLVKGLAGFPKKMFSRSASTNSGSEQSYPTRRATAGTDPSVPKMPGALNGGPPPGKPVPQSRYLPKPPSQPPSQPPQFNQPPKPLHPSIAELNANTMLLRPYPAPPLSEIPEVESNASPPPQVVRLSISDQPTRARTSSIRRKPPPSIMEAGDETGEDRHEDRTESTIPRITIMEFNESRNTQYPSEQIPNGNAESPAEETMPGGLPLHPSGPTLSYVSSDNQQNQEAPVFPTISPPPIRSPSPPHSDTPSSPSIRSPSPSPSPSPPRAEPNPNARPPTGILFRPQNFSNNRSITPPPPPSLVPGSTPFPQHHPLPMDDEDGHPGQRPAILFTAPLPPMGGPHDPDDILSPISVHPLPADDYRVMTTMSPEPLATQTGTTLTGSSYYRSDRSFSRNLNPIERFFKRLYNMPWISRDRVTVDYLPGEQEKGGKIRPKKVKPLSSWYHAVLGRHSKRFSNSNSLDLLTTGSGSAHDRHRRPRDEKGDRGRARTKEKRRHHHESSRDREKHHRNPHHHNHSSSRHRHHHHTSHHHRHHSGSRHSKRRRTTSTEDDEVERMKHMPPMPVYPFPYPPYPIPAFPIPVVATTDDGENPAPTSPPRDGQTEAHHHERARTHSTPMGATFGVYSPPGYGPPPGFPSYQTLVAPGAPPVYMFTPQQMGINVKQVVAGNGESRHLDHPHPKIEPVTNSPAAPVAQTLANAAAVLAAEAKAANSNNPSVPGSF